MNLWKDDESRRRSHQRGALRRFKSTASTLMVVLGWLAVFLSLVLAAATWNKSPQIQHRLFVLSGIYAISGGALVIVHFAFFQLPHLLTHRNSESNRRRRHDRAPGPSSRLLPRSNPVAPPGARQEGMALIFVLIMLGLIATLVVESQIASRALLRRNAVIASASSLRRAAADSIRAAIQRIADDDDLLVDHTNESYFASEELTTPDGIATRVTVTDENRFFDMNNLAAKNVPARKTPQDILGDILTLTGDFTPSSYVSALADWTDDNTEGPTESPLYRRLDPPYAAANRYMYEWGETLWVDGGRRDRFARHLRQSSSEAFKFDFTDCATLCPVARERPVPVNVNTATPETLQGLLGIGQDEAVKTILALRALKPIRSLDLIFAVADREFTENLRPYVDVRSSIFRIDSRAYADNKAVNVRALASRDSSGRVEILQWIF